MPRANATHIRTNWARKTWHHKPPTASGTRVYRLEVNSLYQGDVEAEASIQYLIAQNADDTGGFFGLEQVTGSIGDRVGGFVFQHVGTFANGQITEIVTVLPGSGSGDLVGLSGQATFEGDAHAESRLMLFDYRL